MEAMTWAAPVGVVDRVDVRVPGGYRDPEAAAASLSSWSIHCPRWACPKSSTTRSGLARAAPVDRAVPEARGASAATAHLVAAQARAPSSPSARAVEQVAAFWRAIGSKIEIMEAEHHDLVLAVTSHLPHLIAYNIVGTASDLESVTRSEVTKYSAGGFRDFTRIAASDPEFWRDVFLNNKEAVLEVLGRFTEDLIALQRMIRWEQGDGLQDLFTRTRDVRRRIIAAGQETAAPDFGRRSGGED